MTELNQIVNTPIDLDINGVKIKIKKASLYDLALLQDYAKEINKVNPATANMKMLPYAIYLCAKKVDSSITEEFVNDFLPVDLLVKNPDLVEQIMTKLGFI
jgi:hypothetical protein